MNASIFRYVVWIVATLFYSFQYTMRVLPSVAYDNVASRFDGIDASIYANYSSIYYVGYALLHLPIGYALNKLGPRYILPLLMLLSAVGNLPLIYSDSWWLVVVGRFFVGVGSSAAILGVFKSVRIAFKPSMMAPMLGVSVTIGLFGAIFGESPVKTLLSNEGMEYVIHGFVIVGSILAALTLIFSPNIKEESSIKLDSLKSDMKSIFTNKLVMLTALFGALMVGTTEGFADVWGPKFLSALYNISGEDAAQATSYIFFGMAAGALILPLWAERTNAFYAITALSAAVMAVGMLLTMYVPIGTTLLGVTLFIVGVMSAYQVLVVHMNGLNVAPNIAVLSTSFTNMVIMMFGFLFHKVTGIIMTYNWEGKVDAVTNAHVYSVAAYQWGLLVIPIGLVIGCIGLWVIRPRKAYMPKAV